MGQRGVAAVGVGGRYQGAELRACLAGRTEHPRVAYEVTPWGRDDADQSAQERDGFEDQVGAAVGPGPLELSPRNIEDSCHPDYFRRPILRPWS